MPRGKFPSDKQDQFMLRLPDGLRDRIKAQAEKNGRSMNAEIVRVLEREFPKPVPTVARLMLLLGQAGTLRRSLRGEGVDQLIDQLYESIEAIVVDQMRIDNEEARSLTKEPSEDRDIEQDEGLKAEQPDVSRFGSGRSGA
ncbi:Arc family DNA-binding protein [Rhodoligotrophos ferricapiens]|uniref:Arc family DNA-binding protein n=1 Tax=Rhodoligotrophos ferricapiens TaxID=3069264 RepID=UPI00315DDEA0